jgi:hypothetical protein
MVRGLGEDVDVFKWLVEDEAMMEWSEVELRRW